MVSILSLIMTTLVQRDKQLYLETILDEVEKSMGENDLGTAIRKIENVSSFKPSPPPALVDKDGKPVLTP